MGRSLNLQRGEVTLGFWGTLMESMFDAALVAHVATARPRWMIHLLGATDPEPHRASVLTQLKDLPNVVLHGAVAHDELPRYAKAFDVALAPFPDNAFTRGRDPIKVYEYLASQMPVVVSYAHSCLPCQIVYVANSPEEFVTNIELAARTPVSTRNLDTFLAQQTWDARAEQLLTIMRAQEIKPQVRASNSALPSFAKPDTTAVLRYADALEQELVQVQTWARELEGQAQTRGTLERVKRFMPSLRAQTK